MSFDVLIVVKLEYYNRAKKVNLFPNLVKHILANDILEYQSIDC